MTTAPRPEPDRAITLYRKAAARYDQRTRWLSRYRRRGVEQRRLAAGVTVIDAACGTGVNFPQLQQHVGPGGHIVGIDLSPDMLTLARQRIHAHGWHNITLIHAAAEDAPITGLADGALFSFTTDLLASPAAIGNILAHVRTGGWAAAAGFRSPAPWLNPLARRLGRSYATCFGAFDRPWRHLETHLGDIHIRTCGLGAVYIASGPKAGD